MHNLHRNLYKIFKKKKLKFDTIEGLDFVLKYRELIFLLLALTDINTLKKSFVIRIFI